ncbi:thioesterase II family protein [Streptomyces sp. NPDC058045]|uniref:thioesterase II family protein n=1 Tax=Streptomyces sp. NPDC058045 TaxID=3346311 RepID=UPI0036E9E0BB
MTTPATGRSNWLRSFHPAPQAPVRLVCFPHAGGSASYYFPFSAALSPRVDTVSVQYPGRQDRRNEPLVGDLGQLADLIEAELRASGDSRPVAFFGHSMGATVAFEVARRMAERGTPGPVHLFASGRRAPSRIRADDVHLRGDTGLKEELHLLGGTAGGWLEDEDLLAMVLPVIRNDYRAAELYRAEAGATVSAPLTVLTGDSDPRTTAQEAAAWREHTTGAFALHTFPGGHFFLERHQAEITALVAGTLAEDG